MVLLLMLRAWKMTPTDVQAIQVGSSPAMMAALEKGGIDAAVLTEPTFFIAEDLGYRVLADLADMDIYYLHSMIDTTRSYLRSHRDSAIRFIKAYVESIAYFKKNRAESVELMKKSCAPPRHKPNIWSDRTHFILRVILKTLRIRRSKVFTAFWNSWPGTIRAPEPQIQTRSSTQASSKNWTTAVLSRNSTSRRAKMTLSFEERIDPGHGMLLVVDMQNDFCHPEGAAGKRRRDMNFVQSMIPRLVRLVKKGASMTLRFASSAHLAINGPTQPCGLNSKTPSCLPAPTAVGVPNFTPAWNRNPAR
jgi:NMT1/THI5 like